MNIVDKTVDHMEYKKKTEKAMHTLVLEKQEHQRSEKVKTKKSTLSS